MSPVVLNKEEKIKEKSLQNHKKIRKVLLKIRKFVEKNFENVGKEFQEK